MAYSAPGRSPPAQAGGHQGQQFLGEQQQLESWRPGTQAEEVGPSQRERRQALFAQLALGIGAIGSIELQLVDLL